MSILTSSKSLGFSSFKVMKPKLPNILKPSWLSKISKLDTFTRSGTSTLATSKSISPSRLSRVSDPGGGLAEYASGKSQSSVQNSQLIPSSRTSSPIQKNSSECIPSFKHELDLSLTPPQYRLPNPVPMAKNSENWAKETQAALDFIPSSKPGQKAAGSKFQEFVDSPASIVRQIPQKRPGRSHSISSSQQIPRARVSDSGSLRSTNYSVTSYGSDLSKTSKNSSYYMSRWQENPKSLVSEKPLPALPDGYYKSLNKEGALYSSKLRAMERFWPVDQRLTFRPESIRSSGQSTLNPELEAAILGSRPYQQSLSSRSASLSGASFDSTSTRPMSSRTSVAPDDEVTSIKTASNSGASTPKSFVTANSSFAEHTSIRPKASSTSLRSEFSSTFSPDELAQPWRKWRPQGMPQDTWKAHETF